MYNYLKENIGRNKEEEHELKAEKERNSPHEGRGWVGFKVREEEGGKAGRMIKQSFFFYFFLFLNPV